MLSELKQTQKKKKMHDLTFILNIKTVKYTESESRIVITKVRKVGEMGGCLLKGTKLQLCIMNKSRDSMYSVMTIVNNIVLNARNLLRDFRWSHYQRKK